MSTLAPAYRPFTQESFDELLEGRGEPQWLQQLRREAWNTFVEKPMPSRQDEEWMRTDIRLFRLERFGIPDGRQLASVPPALLAEGVDLAGVSHGVNGRNVASRLEPAWQQQGVLFGSLPQALQEHPKQVQPFLGQKVVDPHYDKFSALHAACWTSGTFLYVPPGVVVDQPFLAHTVIGDGGVDLSRTLVVLDEGAEATYLHEWGSPRQDDHGLFCGATEIILLPGARLRYVNLQDWGHGVWHFGHQHARVHRDASLQWTIGALGSRLAKVNQRVKLVGVGAECQVNGALFTEGKQHLSYHTLQHHAAPHCRSDFLYKAALQDQSRTVWRGMIKVDAGAQKTDGYQRNDNLLLSNQARSDAIPGLEIEADDVRCTHGSTTARVDDELIFYAQARGYTRKEAVRMIVSGFFQQVFDRITIDSVREALSGAIARRVREFA